jgi:ATP/maltotriose-dependent transcriptional regulator MalT/DNA-binding SARP family transcriptional activator
MNLTKFLPPRPTHILERERLLAKLQAWEDRKLVIIHAQAGQGKSTLAADYVRSLRSPSIWYNMDREDDNTSVFFSCLGQAVQRAFPRLVSELPPAPVNRFGIGSMESGAARWLDRVVGNLSQPLLVVFDEFNNITPTPELRSLTKVFLECTPPNVRFMIVSRTRPDIELARLRAKQDVGELAGSDLRFIDSETHELFNSVYGMPMPESETSAVNRVAEGWPAGLVLMHEYFAGAPEQGKKAALLGSGIEGFRTHVFDYLAQEVFSNLSRDLQRFLLCTSITDYLPVELMERLAGLAGPKKAVAASVRSIVGDLRNRNLFVTALDDDATVIRYHALFREFLQRKFIAQTDPAVVRKLYSTAASYFEESGDAVRMVDLMISSGQFDQAVRRIESLGLELIARGQIQTVLRWIQALPLDSGNRPWFLFYRAMAFRYKDPAAALNFFELALSRFSATRSARDRTLGRMLSLCGLIEACFYAGGNFKRMEKAAASASALLKHRKGASTETRARLSLAIGLASLFIGRLRLAAGYLGQALELFRASGEYFYQVQSASYLAGCFSYLGDFPAARAALGRGFEALKSIPHETGGDAGLRMAQAMTSLFEGRFAEAQESLNRCFSLASRHDLEAFTFFSLDIGGWHKTAVGDYEAAEDLLKKCKGRGEERGNVFFMSSAAHLLAVSYLHQNKLDRAESEAEYALSVRARSGSKLFHAGSLAVCGAIDIKRGRFARAEGRLMEARRIFRQCEAAQQEANVLLALAELNLKKKNEGKGIQFLRDGFRLGEERGFTYYYLFAPADLAALAREALNRGVCRDFCTLLLDKLDQPESAPRLRIFCLGGFAVVRNGEPVKDAEWKSKQAKTLLKVLVAHQGRKYPREALMEALWPDDSPATQRVNLTSLLHRARKVIDVADKVRDGQSCILTGDDHLCLDASRVWTDVGQFLSHLVKAARLKASGPERSIEEYDKALRLYRGDFLPDELYDDWASASREQLRAQYFAALKGMANIAESSGDRAKAAEAYTRLFQADESNEEACRWLMSHFLAAGDRTEALRTYERCQLALRRALDMEPEEQTKKLHRSIIGG